MYGLNRDFCVFTGQKDLEPIYSFKDFPIFMGCVDHPLSEDKLFDMNWFISRSSGSIQLNPLVPLDILYGQSHGSGSIGKAWEKHHKSFAEFIAEQKQSKNILEIGGGHGITAKNYIEIVPESNWTMVEPNPTNMENPRIKVKKGFFTKDFKIEDQIDTVVHSHLLEHIYEPIDFFNQINQFLVEGSSMVFSIPNLKVMLEKCYTNCINFEHTIFFTEPYIEYALSKTGFEIVNKKFYLEDHSIFYFTKKINNKTKIDLSHDLYNSNTRLFKNYIHTHKILINKLNQKLNEFQGQCYLFGAHIFSQYLISFGLNTKNIECVLDNDPKKQGGRLYGTSLFVSPPDSIRNMDNVAVILKAGQYQEEVKKQLLEINSDLIIWE